MRQRSLARRFESGTSGGSRSCESFKGSSRGGMDRAVERKRTESERGQERAKGRRGGEGTGGDGEKISPTGHGDDATRRDHPQEKRYAVVEFRPFCATGDFNRRISRSAAVPAARILR